MNVTQYLGPARRQQTSASQTNPTHDIELRSIMSYNRYWLRDDLALKATPTWTDVTFVLCTTRKRWKHTYIYTYNSPYLGGKGQPGFFFRHFFNGVKIGGAFFPDLAHFICHIRKYCVISKMHYNYSLLALFSCMVR